MELDYSTKLMRLKCTLLAASKRSDTVTIHPTLSNTSALCCLLISSSHVTVCAMSNLRKQGEMRNEKWVNIAELMKLFCPDDHEVMLPCTHLSSALRAALYSGSVKASQRSSASSAVNNRSPRVDVAFICLLYKVV